MECIKKAQYSEQFDDRYNLCLEENIQIMLYPDTGSLLNQRCDLIARCRYRITFEL